MIPSRQTSRFGFLILFSMLVVPTGRASTNEILLTTLNCYWFFGEEQSQYSDKPLSRDEYSLKAGHLIGLLPKDAPLFVGLQEVGNDADVEALAYSARRRYGRAYARLFVQGKDTATRQDVGALLDTSRGWGVYGRPARVSDLERELSKHMVVRLTNAVTTMDVCVVHLRVPRNAEGLAKQRGQNAALLRWAMRHLATDPKANLVIMGDFNEGGKVGSPEQSLAVLFQARPPIVDAFSLLTGRIRTHLDGGAYDRILISEAIAIGSAGLKLGTVTIGEHGKRGGDERRLYTDHFPVSVRLSSPQ